MDSYSGDPVQDLGLRIAHVGINAASSEEAERIAERFATLMGLARNETAPISVFSGTLIETMRGTGRGTHGHIGFHVDDLDTAEAWFSDRGFTLDEESRVRMPDGSTRLIYFKEPIGGFAIHLTQDD